MSITSSITIFAQSSAIGKSGVSVFRLSGPKSLHILQLLTNIETFQPRHMHHVQLYDKSQHIDDALACYFPTPNSFTGEDVVELYTHGSIAIAKILTHAILSHNYVRMAEAGEFTKRAVLNQKIDLTAAEGIIDLIHAETDLQHKQSLRQASGELNRLYTGWRTQLLRIMSLIEAFIDFPDEDIPTSAIEEAESIVFEIIRTIQNHLNDNRRGEILRNGISLAIFGPPNVGKSTLSNYLAQRDVSIVSPIAGTTRDIIQTYIDMNGYPIILSDTAGIRSNTTDIVELEGMKRANNAIQNADIKLHLVDPETYVNIELFDGNTIYVMNKVDNVDTVCPKQFIAISLKNATGLDVLKARIVDMASMLSMPTEQPVITRERHRIILYRALDSLLRCDLRHSTDLVLVAEDLRIAIRELGAIVGRVDVEEILSEIFSTFCIGK